MSGYRKLGKRSDQRKAMLRAMVTYLLENGQIKTTYARAKEVAPVCEKMITLAKHNNLASYRQALSFITKEDVAKKLFDEIGPKYATRDPAAATPPKWQSFSWCNPRFKGEESLLRTPGARESARGSSLFRRKKNWTFERKADRMEAAAKPRHRRRIEDRLTTV